MNETATLLAQFRQLTPDSQRRLLTAMLTVNPPYLTDAQVATMLQIDCATLRRWLREGPPPTKPDSVDIRDAEPITVGGQRRWNGTKIHLLLTRE